MEYDPEADLKVLEAMVNGLNPYLYGDTLYGTLSPNLPKLTVGALLLRLYRLQGIKDQLSQNQRSRVDNVQQTFEKQRYEWLNHYKGKIEKELATRIRSVKAFLNDYADSPSRERENYLPAATERTILRHLQVEAQHLDLWTADFASELRLYDSRLRQSMSSEGKFMWGDLIKPLYPQEDFWWLYGYPKE